MAEKIELGKTYKHKLHGFTGVAIAREENYCGPSRVLLERFTGFEIKHYCIAEVLLEPVDEAESNKV